VDVFKPGMRGVIARGAMLVLVVLASCGGDVENNLAQRYLSDAAFRRAAMTASLTTTHNSYAQLRLARYDSGDARDWSRLPEWNPPIALSTHETPASLQVSREALLGDNEALRALGELAFSRYPSMLASPPVETTLRDRSVYEHYGLRTSSIESHGADLVRVSLPDGTTGLAFTCAACHASSGPRDTLVMGLPNTRLDLGALTVDSSPMLAPEVVARVRQWGTGRVDVSSDDGSEPVAMPDLRAVRFQHFLHRAGAVRLHSLTALAVRIETLLITSHHEVVRPPRVIALALAVYLWNLGNLVAPHNNVPGRGADVFAQHCGFCHAGEALAGGLITPETADTEETIAWSATRGTGAYRVPSLRGLGQRESLLHDGSVPSIDALLDPARTGEHRVGRGLSSNDRAALSAYLRAL
jgi:mono/diheme cytochrome c family protein